MPSIFINAAPGKNATPHREYSRIIYMSEKWQVVLELWRAVCYDKGKSERGMQMNSQQRRQQLLVLLRQNSGPVSATDIAKEFGKNHTTVLYALKKVEQELPNSSNGLQDNIRDITANVNSKL